MSRRADNETPSGDNPIDQSGPDNGNSVQESGPDFTCSKDRKCSNGACCGKDNWCGYGPTYCGKGCQSNCDAFAECGQYAKKPGQTCPLNVCCSEFGYCGTQTNYCNNKCQSNCGAPTRPKGKGGDVRRHIIGYYESWKSSGENCGEMTPYQIPAEHLDAVNLAFAYITPKDYDIVPMENQSESIFQQVADVKKRSPSTEIWLSVGGWTFNDNHTATQPIFGELAADSAKAKGFAHKLVAMMNHYGFDGVDLDWEYPGATDRGGKKETELKNFPTLLKNIRKVLDQQLQRPKISITVPTSYWYLRWFDLPELAKHLDFFNVMSYDLHGTWDSSNPIGPYVYAHTNLTEIKLALDLFWREDISPDIINLGLAFYGRSFKLKDPSCSDPGCGFEGPGEEGRCTKTAGILSYREINELRGPASTYKGSYTVHDKEAGVNYMVYGENLENWISFDTKETFEQKIDYANELGLRGLLIWAIDQDDDRYTALKAVTGDEISPRVEESEVIGHWDVNKCYVTECKVDCRDGFTKMTNLNDDSKTKKGCGGNHKRRTLCCPSWGAPDPSTCSWKDCRGTCDAGDILFATDHYGNGGRQCWSGTKKFCCPANNGNRAVASCSWSSKDSCPKERPQKLYSYTEGQQLDSETVFSSRTFCCPEKPKFENCKWYGDVGSCNNNFCPKDKIQVAGSSTRPGGRCSYGRKAVMCCDPPMGDDPILPVALEDLFPYIIPEDSEPVYYESIDSTSDSVPNNDDLEDTNEQPFAWIIMVGDEEDVQSLRKRDGSHLELFDCPNPTQDDYQVQKLKAVCMSEGEGSNCEHLKLGGAHGTIARLPEHCGPDEWVRVVSFEPVEDHPIPSHLQKRAPQGAKIYQLEYDYNFHERREDGGEVFVRIDGSTHPGYWDQIVASKTGQGITRRNPENWRQDEMAWFAERGFVHNQTETTKRGESPSTGWWVKQFKTLLDEHSDYGVHKKFDYKQVLYNANKTCRWTGGLGQASLEARLEGSLETTFDYGISLIGTLKQFNFDQAYAYFHVSNFDMEAVSVVDAYAGIQMQTRKSPILGWLDLFGANFNVKGLVEVGPFFDIQAQLRAALKLSGEARAGLTFKSRAITWMYPQAMDEWPDSNAFTTHEPDIGLRPKKEISVRASGDLTIAINPALGFQVKLTWLGKQLVNQDIRLNFQTDYTFSVTAQKGGKSTCDGLLMGVDLRYGLTIDMSKPLPGWGGTGLHHTVVAPKSIRLAETQCRKWETPELDPTDGDGKRVVNSRHLFSRVDGVEDDALFPDTAGASLRCLEDFNTPTGDCQDRTADDDDDEEGESLVKRNPLGGSDKSMFFMCSGARKIKIRGLGFPSSGEMTKASGKYKDTEFETWGPEDRTDCDDYSFEKSDKPPASESKYYESEHVLEWQTLKGFLEHIGDVTDKEGRVGKSPFKGWGIKNPVSSETLEEKKKYPQGEQIKFCDYMWLWWSEHQFEYKDYTMSALDHLRLAIPNNDFYTDELQLLWKGSNGVKQRGGKVDGKQRDVNDAINVLRDLMFAVRYMAKPDVKRVMFNQADRIYKRLNEFEDMFVAEGKIEGFNEDVYMKLDLGEKWQKWCKDSYTTANMKQQDFLELWIPRLKTDYLGDEAEGSDGDDEGSGGENAGSDAGSKGGTETNPEIIKRVQKLVDAYEEFKQNPWTNPFNWD
ncbi:hypothetical protein NW767_008204 [Fusarium falciforme]|nr:hypothetical protein NW767_008204 [Fusarium falciforme]